MDAGVDAGMPPPPALGVEVDRVGRPLANILLNDGFLLPGPMVGASRDAWNADSNPSAWPTTWATSIGSSLAILDGFDTVCGNGFAAGALGPTRYATPAGLLADDRLWLNTAGTTSTTYLAVEYNAVGLLLNTDVGGRKLNYDVIDRTYSLLIAGNVTGVVTDGVSPDADTQGTTFPYLAAPH
jgi:hypothetical protein